MKFKQFYSQRGIPLFSNASRDVPTLTVEDYGKWYDLYLILPDGTARIYEWAEYEDVATAFVGTAWADHVPNPRLVQAIAEAKNYDIVTRAFEVMVGRWTIQIEDKY